MENYAVPSVSGIQLNFIFPVSSTALVPFNVCFQLQLKFIIYDIGCSLTWLSSNINSIAIYSNFFYGLE